MAPSDTFERAEGAIATLRRPVRPLSSTAASYRSSPASHGSHQSQRACRPARRSAPAGVPGGPGTTFRALAPILASSCAFCPGLSHGKWCKGRLNGARARPAPGHSRERPAIPHAARLSGPAMIADLSCRISGIAGPRSWKGRPKWAAWDLAGAGVGVPQGGRAAWGGQIAGNLLSRASSSGPFHPGNGRWSAGRGRHCGLRQLWRLPRIPTRRGNPAAQVNPPRPASQPERRSRRSARRLLI